MDICKPEKNEVGLCSMHGRTNVYTPKDVGIQQNDNTAC